VRNSPHTLNVVWGPLGGRMCSVNVMLTFFASWREGELLQTMSNRAYAHRG
jgi:hypothetical protein